MTNRTELAENQEKKDSPQKISGVASARRTTSERSTSKRKFLKFALLTGGGATLALAWPRGVNASSLYKSSTSLVSSKTNGKQAKLKLSKGFQFKKRKTRRPQISTLPQTES